MIRFFWMFAALCLLPAFCAAAELAGEYSVKVNGIEYEFFFTEETVMNVGGGLVGIRWEEARPRAEGGVVTTSQKTLYTPYWIYEDLGWPSVGFDVGDMALEFYIVDGALLQVPSGSPLILVDPNGTASAQ